MHRIIKILSLFFFLIVYNKNQAQCVVTVDIANLQHITCPNGGAIGGANIIQASYIYYSWQNITNGQLYNGGGGYGGTIRADLDAGLYVITASSPYSSSCPSTIYSDTFEILEAEPSFQFNPTQACPDTCNVEVAIGMQIAISGVNYSSSFNTYPITPLPYLLDNQCGGSHTYEIFANGISCGIQNIGISQFAQMNLATSVINATCTQQGSATVSITGVGGSAISTYCNSSPQYNTYTTIDNIVLVGDNTTISNNTSSICDTYQDYTAQSADVNPGSSYNLNVDLGTCNASGFALIDIANVYVDWNIDGDFNDANEWVGQVGPTQSPSAHTIPITVPVGAIPGQSRMRIVAQNNQYQPTNQALPCDDATAYFGSTEDYTILVNGAVATPVSYLWSDGQTTAIATNLSAGTYTVTITDANGCSETDTAIVSGSGNVSVIAGSDQTICNGGVPNNLTANGSVSGTYNWQPATDFINANAQNPVFSNGLTTTTPYTVTFTDGNSCIATDFVVITVNPLPTVTASSSIASPLCDGDALTLNGGGVTTYTWDNGVVDNIPFTPGTGTVIYTVTGTDGNLCENTDTISVTVNPLPTATIAISETACLGGVVPDLLAYGSLPNWYLDAALTIHVFTGNYFATGETAVGLYTYYVTETLNGCEGPSVPVTLEIYALPIVTVTADQTICDGYAPSSLNASSASAGTYSWVDAADPLGIVLGTGSNFPPPPLTTTTTYTVTFTETSSGCTDDDDVTITVNPNPTVILSAAPNPACIGDDIILTATPSISVNEYRFMYNDGSGWTNLTTPSWDINNPVIYNNITQSIQFRVKVREANGCIPSSWSPTITVPIVTFNSLSIWHN